MDLMTTHTLEELQDLLATGGEFLELGNVKIEAEHPVLGLDQLRVSLETRRSTRFDVSSSIEEEYVEEIDLAIFIQAMLVKPALVPRVIIPPGPAVEMILAVSTLWATVADKGKGVYVPSPRRVPAMRLKGIVIRVPVANAHMIE